MLYICYIKSYTKNSLNRLIIKYLYYISITYITYTYYILLYILRILLNTYVCTLRVIQKKLYFCCIPYPVYDTAKKPCITSITLV